jgi:hypothetical protein
MFSDRNVPGARTMNVSHNRMNAVVIPIWDAHAAVQLDNRGLAGIAAGVATSFTRVDPRRPAE